MLVFRYSNFEFCLRPEAAPVFVVKFVLVAAEPRREVFKPFFMLILGIETSCDETSASVVKDGKEILSNVIFSQEVLHRQFGGVSA